MYIFSSSSDMYCCYKFGCNVGIPFSSIGDQIPVPPVIPATLCQGEKIGNIAEAASGVSCHSNIAIGSPQICSGVPLGERNNKHKGKTLPPEIEKQDL